MRWLVIFSVFFFAVWADSFIGTTDIANWRIENTLTAITVLCLIFTFKWYRFSTVSYFLICGFLCLHVYGSKYTYAENPFGYWLQDFLNTSRNPYDRLVHMSFGLLLYFPFYEILLNGLKLRKREALIIPVLIVLSASAIYEIIEWLVADIFFVEQGISYLGTQGDVWDSQEDMFVAFIGSLLAAVIFYVYRLVKRTHKSL